MQPLPHIVRKIYVDESVSNTPIVESILDFHHQVPCEVIEGPEAVYRRVARAGDPERVGKQVLLLTRNRGRFLRGCPGTRDYICCGYRILHIGTYCPMDCAYCILQAYYHPPVLQYFVNQDAMLEELDQVLREKRPEVRRIGTGEFTDSLVWEDLSDLTGKLVARFGEQDHAVLEIKSKTVNIRRLEGLPHNRRTILAWSVNTPTVIAEQERGTTPLSARLAAAARCERWGYPLAFHFDPMVLYPGCADAYERVVREIFAHVSPENVVWISLGTFRHMPDLKPVVQRRFPDSKLPYGEFVSGLDGKMRYFKPLRVELYNRVARAISNVAPDVRVYYCMEDEAVWRDTLGFVPDEKGGLPAMLDRSAARVCGVRESGVHPA
ncbi:MAG: radical SAM protein [Desulfatibacillaceae bacterium]